MSFDVPEYTADITGTGTVRLLEAIRQASPQSPLLSGQFLGDVRPGAGRPADGNDAVLSPQPVRRAKVFSYWLTVNYRESYNMHASNGILFNHESPRRGETFVTRKITRAVARIKAGVQKKLYMGNLDSKRDWGYAPEYVEAMWLMLQQDKPDDYVIATNETHTIREFLEVSFGRVGLDWEKYVEIDPRYFRPAEVDLLIGDPAKAKKQLGWDAEDDVQGVGRHHDRCRRGPAQARDERQELPAVSTVALTAWRRRRTIPHPWNGVACSRCTISDDRPRKIFVAGHRGLVGSAIVRALQAAWKPASRGRSSRARAPNSTCSTARRCARSMLGRTARIRGRRGGEGRRHQGEQRFPGRFPAG